MPRFSSCFRFSTWFSRPAISLSLGVSLGLFAVFSSAPARADEFAILPPGDAIYAQLATLGRAASASKTPAPLTRYEAALQAARAILELQNGDDAGVPRENWRALSALTISLKNELRQLGIDVDAARALATKNLHKAARKTDVSGAPTANFSPPVAPPKSAAARGSSLLSPQNSAVAGQTLTRKNSEGALEVQLAPRLRAETALQAVQRTGLDPLGAADGFPLRGESAGSKVESLASQTVLSYDLSRYLTLRAANSKLNWNGAGDTPLLSPLLGAPFFEGASRAGGTGGGVDVNLGSGLKFSTEIEKLRANTGASTSRIGGGASLSAFQNRLSMNMSVSRLSPEDKAALPSTAAQIGASLDVSQRLSLSLLYQGLFAPIANSSASRVSGGVSLSF
ncbi:hypothetical protein B1R32_12816 [Abditibacterium utsteinense]|uniref:Uncharacterized protein n=2 Tax=Abditibacterium utsteinense TaxID=1960156 RepID=A0A2S8SP57_9BACT|nr:hypothetical protein B1R32_12816 [Abditibacterium utsteinense]